MTYFLAPGLVQLRSEVNIRWPDRDKTSDGWIGDTAHSTRVSDHNPDYSAGGIVRAIDVDRDGIDVDRLLLSLIGSARVSYVIWSGRIWQNPAVYQAGGWRAYTGANGHYHHVHISIRRGYEYSVQPWGVLDAAEIDNPIAGQGDLPDVTVNDPDPISPTDWFDMATKADLIDAIREAREAEPAEVVFFALPDGKVHEANRRTGLYYQVLNGQDLADRKAVLNRQGVKWENWKNAAGTWEVANPEAFGKLIA